MAEPASAPGVVLVDPDPRTLDMVFAPSVRARLEALGRVVAHDGDGPMAPGLVDAHLAEAVAVVGQTDLPAERLERAPHLRAVVNIEGNFLPNVDYETCLRRGVHVLNASPAFAPAVAEAALGLAIDLARGITAADRAFRAGRERYGLDANAETFLLAGSTVGIVGLGDLGRELRRLLVPFGCPVLAHDPWLPELLLRETGTEPVGLDELLRRSRVVFVFASATSDNVHMLGERELGLLAPGSALVIASRAAVVDFDALVRVARTGAIRVATDVFPVEPVPADDPIREVEAILLSPHRTGGMREAFLRIGELAVGDLELVLRGLPPVLCKRAERETVGRMRSRPVARS